MEGKYNFSSLTNEGRNHLSKSYKRLVFDEICANFLVLSKNREKIKKK